ncbi:MAG: DNA-formamidopyrimidine glycosylase [Candidatus Moranbacteria bacterium RIFCSPLOWO2_02_FULL_48_19]|nr:MAG: DNA-formamidopyrimidine glycosylase [Candidatus Moranbacteria bacterium RIFCSPLOWO2_02_FULL_48_19]OGI29879.1 MAG: DNA-formamidopyrimidine glycosylase [Candidatus Moranbacteria bacterium RIFCSPLOWO2_12_FULL_48_12]
MPELPEVQTVVTQLERKIVGKTIKSFWSDWKKRIFPSFAVFAKQVRGAIILGTRRFGKHIVIDLDDGYSVVAHLKMTGHFLVKDKGNRLSSAFTKDPVNGYIHHIFTFTDKTTLEFSDMRKFGWLRVMRTGEVETLPSIASLGIDALSPKLTQKHFQGLLSEKKKRPIGVVLLEQDLIAGIGNIYRSEALFLAGVLPTRRIETLTKKEWLKILPAIKKVLQRAVKLRGTSDGDFRDTDGLEGRFQRMLHVYGRTGKSCKKCDTIILRKKIGQRSVFYCPRCQK